MNGIVAQIGRVIAQVVALLDRIPYFAIALLARVAVGLVFFKSGLTKVDGLEINAATLYLFANEYKVPLLNPSLAAHLSAFFELVCPPLLWIGLAARFAALALLGMTLVIEIFVFPSAYVEHGLWATALLLIAARGAGLMSLDHLIARWWSPSR